MKPFADDDASVSIGELTIENGSEQLSIFGSLDITHDKLGLKRAKQLKALVDDIVAALEAENDLPAKIVEQVEKPAKVKNPFA